MDFRVMLEVQYKIREELIKDYLNLPEFTNAIISTALGKRIDIVEKRIAKLQIAEFDQEK